MFQVLLLLAVVVVVLFVEMLLLLMFEIPEMVILFVLFVAEMM